MKNKESQLIEEENERLRWLRWRTDLLKAVLYQDPTLTKESARRLVWQLRKETSEVFPGKESTFDLILLPRFERVIQERWGGEPCH